MAGIETLNTLLDLRHSCRAFLPEQVDNATINQIVETAGKVPSWCNAQSWSVVVTKGAATGAFRACMMKAQASGAPIQPDFDWPTSYSGPYQARRREVGWQLYDAVGVTKGDKEAAARQSARNFAFFDAPHVAIIHSPKELGAYGAVAVGGFVTAFCLAATALEIGTSPQAAVAAYAPQIRNHFGLGKDRQVVCAISFGKSDTKHPANSFRATRAPITDICAVISDVAQENDLS